MVKEMVWVLILWGVWAIGGCATRSDLETLKQEVQAAVSTTRQDLDQKIAPLAAQVEMLKGETKAGFETTRKQIEERERQLTQDLKALQEATARLTEAVKDIQAKIAESAARHAALAKENRELRASVQSTSRTLLEFLKGEEAQLKEGLRWLQSVIKDLAGAEEKPK